MAEFTKAQSMAGIEPIDPKSTYAYELEDFKDVLRAGRESGGVVEFLKGGIHIHQAKWPDIEVKSLRCLVMGVVEIRKEFELPFIDPVLIAYAMGKGQKRDVIWDWAYVSLIKEAVPSLLA
jgi:hypothetical protein